MCGIVGYIGNKQASEIIIDGLSKLEYRGYDSAGIAIVNGGEKISWAKKQGRLAGLEEILAANPIAGSVGIGHTRWATHGAPSDVNSHPHLNEAETLAVVHNGIIENYMQLREMLTAEGYHFKSETDTEVAVHLIDKYYEGDLLEAVRKAVSVFRGAYALGVVSAKHPNELIAVRKESPLIVGVGEGEYFIASDVPAILKYTRNVYYLENDEMIHVKDGVLTIYDGNNNVVEKELKTVEWDIEAASKGGFDHFMMKEIYDQPQAIRDTLLRRLDDEGMIHLDDIKLTREDLDGITKMYIVACGTAYHAGLVGKFAIEQIAKVPVEVDIASEFRYSNTFIDEHTMLIVVSQSGETADTLAAMKLAKSKGARVLAITNVVGSSVAREAHDVFYTWAGPEIAVASTKAYTAQMIAFYMIALDFAYKKGTVTLERYHELIKNIEALAPKVEAILANKEIIEQCSHDMKDTNNAFYLGRGVDFTTAREAALKLKEISYIYTEAAGELKHGPIAITKAPLAFTSLMLEIIFSSNVFCVTMQRTGVPSSISAIGPCLSSPAANASV